MQSESQTPTRGQTSAVRKQTEEARRKDKEGGKAETGPSLAREEKANTEKSKGRGKRKKGKGTQEKELSRQQPARGPAGMASRGGGGAEEAAPAEYGQPALALMGSSRGSSRAWRVEERGRRKEPGKGREGPFPSSVTPLRAAVRMRNPAAAEWHGVTAASAVDVARCSATSLGTNFCD